MSSFDYNAPAEPFFVQAREGKPHQVSAFRDSGRGYAVEDLRMPKAFGAWLEVGDARFDSIEIQRLYEANDYPLRKPQ